MTDPDEWSDHPPIDSPEAATKELAADAREALRLAGVGSWIWDIRAGAHYWSEEIYRIYGRDPALQPAVYPEVRTYFTQESWERLAAAVEQALAEGTPYECDAEVVRPDDTRRWIVARGAAARDGDGTIVRLHGTVQDVTERKLTENEHEITVEFLTLLNGSRTLRELIAAASAYFQRHSGCEAVGIRLHEGNDYPYYETRGFPDAFVLQENSLCSRNQAGEPLRNSSGYPILECMCGNVICGRFDPAKPFFSKSGSFWSNCTTELLATTTEADRQSRTRNRCNGEGYESVALIPLRGGGESIGLLQVNDRRKNRFTASGIARWERLAGYLAVAVTKFRAADELHRSEEALRDLNADLERRVAERTIELEQANRELESFSYSVSHDLRAPLRAMSGFSRALAEEYGNLLPGQAREYLNQIDHAGHTMAMLIEGLLTLSRTARGEVRHDVVDLTALSERLLAELARGDGGRRFAVQVDAGMVVHGDARMIEALMRNLLDNARKYSAHEPAPSIRVYAEEHEGRRRHCVSDNGVGFDMAHARRLFQPFQRLHRQEDFPGIGVGLATVQRIVHRHGGDIEARGEPGRGATFCFFLPGRQAPPAA